MPFLKARWIHDLPDEAVLWYHELDGSRREVRKVVVFRDGRSERADSLRGTDYAQLSQEPLPTLSDINAQGEFEAREIDSTEFEQAWSAATHHFNIRLAVR